MGRARPSALPRRDRALRQEELRLHGFEGLGLMRQRHLSLSQAAKEVGESPKAILPHIRAALRKDKRGHFVARASDSLTRTLEVMTRDGKVVLPIRGSKQASLIGRHWNALRSFVEFRPSGLREFRAKVIQAGGKKYTLLSDPRATRRFAEAGELSFQTLYSVTR